MNIALDYDNTYTRDPDFWRIVISEAQSKGHEVYCVTARTQQQSKEVYDTIGKLIGYGNCFFTSMRAKKPFMFSNGISIDVWIDDMPFFIENGVTIGC